jgi:hypothetical protein
MNGPGDGLLHSDMVVEEELIDNQETETPMGLNINKGTPLKELIQDEKPQ